jgi:hypothetical protein
MTSSWERPEPTSSTVAAETTGSSVAAGTTVSTAEAATTSSSGARRRDMLEGGVGGDTLYARDRRTDPLLGGRGRDRARVDRRLDIVRAIERFF